MRLKKVLSVIILFGVLPFVTFTVSAEDTTYTEGYYTYVIENDKATITDCDTSIEGNIIIPSELGGCSVTGIGVEAFKYCRNLISITIPDSIVNINNDAFYYCTKLESVTISNNITDIGDYAFYQCTNLKNIVIPETVTNIGGWAFYGCKGLENIIISDSVANIGEYAFSDCTNLVSITVYPNNMNYISENGILFNKSKTELICYPAGKSDSTYNVPNTVALIGSRAFLGCKHIESIMITNNVEKIGDLAFYDCEALKDIIIPDDITTIGSYAFDNTAYYNDLSNWDNDVLYIGKHLIVANSSISGSYVIKSGTSNIADYAFNKCANLECITIPESITSIGSLAFYECTNLTSVKITDISAWCNIDFNSGYSNPLYYADLYIDNVLSTDIIVPEGIFSINDYAFYYYKNLKSVKIPESVISIGKQAFYYCSSLESITVPDSVINIGTAAFYKCTNLESIKLPFVGGSADENTYLGYIFGASSYKYHTTYIPSSLKTVIISDKCTNIDSYAFYYCYNLSSVTIGKMLQA